MDQNNAFLSYNGPWFNGSLHIHLTSERSPVCSWEETQILLALSPEGDVVQNSAKNKHAELPAVVTHCE